MFFTYHLLYAHVGHKGRRITEDECVEQNGCCWDESSFPQCFFPTLEVACYPEQPREDCGKVVRNTGID